MLCRGVLQTPTQQIELFEQPHINKTFSDSPNKTKEAAQTMSSLF